MTETNPSNQGRKPKLPSLTFVSGPNGSEMTVRGREAQTLALLLKTGPNGFTSGEASPLGWARRTSAYIRELRLKGLQILTVWESASDCRIGRYILLSPISVVTDGGAQ